MRNSKGNFIINFIFRMLIGVGIILVVNEYMDYRNIPVSMGINGITLLTSGTLGLPGLFLLYGILFYKLL